MRMPYGAGSIAIANGRPKGNYRAQIDVELMSILNVYTCLTIGPVAGSMNKSGVTHRVMSYAMRNNLGQKNPPEDRGEQTRGGWV